MAEPKKKDAKSHKPRTEFEERVVQVRRVSKVVQGGRRMAFSALVVIGNKQGKVGIGMGKASEVKEAVRKGVEQARRKVCDIALHNRTIPHEVTFKYKAGKVFLRPAKEGTGLIAGGAVRDVLELVGIKDILSKRLGSSNIITNAKATYYALRELESMKDVRTRRALVTSSKKAPHE
jgi:small subunit ribosomal protein S5